MSIRILDGDCRTMLATLPDASVQCCVTSPPYYGLRDYGVDGQIGLEQSPDAYVAELVAVFREVRRCLRDDGTVWLNLGDSYAASATGSLGKAIGLQGGQHNRAAGLTQPNKLAHSKPKDLLMIPARVALALQSDGWWLRSDIIWHKPSCMPESVTDRPTSAHEHVFLLTKRATYFYDADAVRQEAVKAEYHARYAEAAIGYAKKQPGQRQTGMLGCHPNGRNLRNVWTIATQPYSGAHFATMPPDLVERCINAGTKPGDTVLDPFGGAGTTGLVADRLGRSAILIELNPAYAELARERVRGDCPMFASVA